MADQMDEKKARRIVAEYESDAPTEIVRQEYAAAIWFLSGLEAGREGMREERDVLCQTMHLPWSEQLKDNAKAFAELRAQLKEQAEQLEIAVEALKTGIACEGMIGRICEKCKPLLEKALDSINRGKAS